MQIKLMLGLVIHVLHRPRQSMWESIASGILDLKMITVDGFFLNSLRLFLNWLSGRERAREKSETLLCIFLY